MRPDIASDNRETARGHAGQSRNKRRPQLSAHTVVYSDTLSDGRHVEISAHYQAPVFTPGAEEAEAAYVLHVYDYDHLGSDIRLELAHKLPAEYQRLRRESLERVLWEMDCLAAEHADSKMDARR